MTNTTHQEKFTRLLNIMRELRSERGCSWDRAQSHDSLIPFLLEESYEVIGAIESRDWMGLSSELGDVLLQIVFHAQIASEAGSFTIDTVLEALTAKLIRRHPHVFSEIAAIEPEEVVRNWKSIKREESKEQGARSVLDGISTALPQLIYAQKNQERAASVGFDWDTIEQVKEKVREEWKELWESVENAEGETRIEEEMGDLMFALVNLARFLHIQPEEALRKANQKFARRFKEVERRAGGGDNMIQMPLKDLDSLWNDVKSDEHSDDRSI